LKKLISVIRLFTPCCQSLFAIGQVKGGTLLVQSFAPNQTIIIYFVFVFVCVENADSVAGLKGRVKTARDKTKDLFKAVNGTMETLNAIPNGMTAQLHYVCLCV